MSKSKDQRNRSLKTEGETESGDPAQGSLEREKGREKRAIAEI